MTKKIIRKRALLVVRDQKVLRRYFEMTEIEHLDSKYAVKILSENEFFKSEKTLWDIIKSNCDILDGFRKELLEQ